MPTLRHELEPGYPSDTDLEAAIDKAEAEAYDEMTADTVERIQGGIQDNKERIDAI